MAQYYSKQMNHVVSETLEHLPKLFSLYSANFPVVAIGIYNDDEELCRALVAGIDSFQVTKPAQITIVHSKTSKMNVKSLLHNIILVSVDKMDEWHYQEEFHITICLLQAYKLSNPCTGIGMPLQAFCEATRFEGRLILATYLGTSLESKGMFLSQPSDHELKMMLIRNEISIEFWNVRTEICDKHINTRLANRLPSKTSALERKAPSLDYVFAYGKKSLKNSLTGGNPSITIGLWMTNKKLRRFFWKRLNNFEFGFGYYAMRRGVTLVPITHGTGVYSSAPVRSCQHLQDIDIVVQKDGYGLEMKTTPLKYSRFVIGYEDDENYSDPGIEILSREIPVIDPPDNVRITFDRLETAKVCASTVRIPPHIVWGISSDESTFDMDNRALWYANLKRDESFSFPAIAKPIDAEQHENLMIVFDSSGLRMLEPSRRGWIIQKYLPHNNVLFKVSVVGSEISYTQRPTLHLDSPEFKNKRTAMPLGRISSVKDTNLTESGIGWIDAPPGEAIFKSSRLIQKALRISIFGFDLIRCSLDDKIYVIDINYFPSYVDVPNKNYFFLKHLLEVVNNK